MAFYLHDPLQRSSCFLQDAQVSQSPDRLSFVIPCFCFTEAMKEVVKAESAIRERVGIGMSVPEGKLVEELVSVRLRLTENFTQSL